MRKTSFVIVMLLALTLSLINGVASAAMPCPDYPNCEMQDAIHMEMNEWQSDLKNTLTAVGAVVIDVTQCEEEMIDLLNCFFKHMDPSLEMKMEEFVLTITLK